MCIFFSRYWLAGQLILMSMRATIDYLLRYIEGHGHAAAIVGSRIAVWVEMYSPATKKTVFRLEWVDANTRAVRDWLGY
jgi:hypothetical protein